ncbi:catalase family peroxidase [Mucilaginibacter terrenus]|uniref:Catalase-related peroxidase n=2 Tax=Mucilaginibacter terrenus TaxID=2482727 RepID=A0A3E2NYH4_9SPHI|nr:catalase family peroxidase [Mucilaginibacter terrenus]
MILTKKRCVIAGLLLMIVNGSVAFAQITRTQATPAEMVDALHAAFGKHPNARAVHAKGVFLEGTFAPAAIAKNLSMAPHLQYRTLPVMVRFSDFTGIPDISDTTGGSNPRGMAIKFQLGNGKSTDIIAHSFNGFPVATTDEFREFLLNISRSGPKAPHPNAIEQFLGTHPIAKHFVTTQKPPSVSYGTLSYFGVNSFKFINSKGISCYIRYQIIPEAGEQFLTAAQFKNTGDNYLSEEIKTRIGAGAVKFKLYAQVAETGDKIENPSIAWPNERKRILLGTITISRLADNSLEADKALIYNPGNLPKGIEIADPMVADRARLYPVSVKERQQSH